MHFAHEVHSDLRVRKGRPGKAAALPVGEHGIAQTLRFLGRDGVLVFSGLKLMVLFGKSGEKGFDMLVITVVVGDFIDDVVFDGLLKRTLYVLLNGCSFFQVVF